MLRITILRTAVATRGKRETRKSRREKGNVEYRKKRKKVGEEREKEKERKETRKKEGGRKKGRTTDTDTSGERKRGTRDKQNEHVVAGERVG